MQLPGRWTIPAPRLLLLQEERSCRPLHPSGACSLGPAANTALLSVHVCESDSREAARRARWLLPVIRERRRRRRKEWVMLDLHKNNCQSPQPGPRGRRRRPTKGGDNEVAVETVSRSSRLFWVSENQNPGPSAEPGSVCSPAGADPLQVLGGVKLLHTCESRSQLECKGFYRLRKTCSSHSRWNDVIDWHQSIRTTSSQCGPASTDAQKWGVFRRFCMAGERSASWTGGG